MSNYKLSYSGGQINNAISRALNPDTTPTQDSTALITSGGVKAAIDNAEKGDSGVIDTTTQTAFNGVLAGNGSTVTTKAVDAAPTADSANLVASGGVKSALDALGKNVSLSFIYNKSYKLVFNRYNFAARIFAVNGNASWAEILFGNGYAVVNKSPNAKITVQFNNDGGYKDFTITNTATTSGETGYLGINLPGDVIYTYETLSE